MNFSDGYSFGHDQVYIDPVKETYATYDNSIIKSNDPSVSHFNAPKGKVGVNYGPYGGYTPVSSETELFSDISQITKMEQQKLSGRQGGAYGDDIYGGNAYEHMERSIRADERKKLEEKSELDEMSKKLAEFQYKHDMFLIFIICLVVYILMHNNNSGVGGGYMGGMMPPMMMPMPYYMPAQYGAHSTHPAK